MELFWVTKIAGAYYVADAFGNMVIGYRTRSLAEAYATGAAKGLFTEAEERNGRFDRARAYLAGRAARIPPPVNQMELF